MVSKVNPQMLEQKVVNGVSMSGNDITVTFTDGTSILMDVSLMPVMQSIAGMMVQINAIDNYIAQHP